MLLLERMLLFPRLLLLGLLAGAGRAAPASSALPSSPSSFPMGPFPTSQALREGPPPALTFPQEEATLDEMFREVEELMEDTQHKLQSAVEEMKAEEEATKGSAEVSLQDLPPNFHNDSHSEIKVGNRTIYRHQEIDKITNNQTGQTVVSETIITTIKDEEKRNHECIIDEDCGTGRYCQFSSFEYTCELCKNQQTLCSRDSECCGDQLCVWGHCVKDASKGSNGTICDNQQGCQPGLCCAFQKGLLFPVCTPLPVEGEPCHDPSNRLLDLITWELEPDGALDRCPCATGLICQPHRHSLVYVCELSFNKTRHEDKEHALTNEGLLFSLLPGDIIEDQQDGDLVREVRRELENLERDLSEISLDEPAVTSDVFYVDEI
ncbi:dickkopf-related protein 3 [Sarcophilus harrisii]|uniref:Dickkopf-related protein 3 n=1 Tax=Sarcophilus harrisii TaxID=9305 RepID=A0A7N4PNC7_SARHA|nr:dickkopf-related protein 3 [Sarcophilus harrisii]XP_031800028.1 dickkopf-related protein 3 [Sarcophilus harrisii]